jgi:hypothetical protein
MCYSATVGPLSFQFSASGVLPVPSATGHTVRFADGAELLTLDENGAIYLLLDHRDAACTGATAYVEFWRSATPTETPLRGLLVLTESHRPAPARAPISSFADLVAALRPD